MLRTEQYQYQPLPTRTSIRLLRISSRDKFNQLECTLRTVDLDDAPSFHALSYTWGNPHARARDGHRFTQHYNALDAEYLFPSAGVPVKCDGKRLLVSRNLYDALRDVPEDAWKTFINRRNDSKGWTRLHTHSINGDARRVRSLIASGADLNTRDREGMTALVWAVRLRRGEVVRLLVEAGAKLDVQDYERRTALDYAREIADEEILGYLTAESAPDGCQQPEEGQGGGPEVWLWVDQVCINQTDPEERSSQVDLMHRIYHQAAFTLLWLGREDGYTKRAAHLIPRFARAGNQFIESTILPYTQNSQELHKNEGIPYVSEGEWDALAALFQRQYFRRLWIVQEIILSGIVVAYCGGVEIPWRLFCITAEMLHYRQLKMGTEVSAKYVPLGEGGRGIEQPLVQLLQWQDRFGSNPPADKPRVVSLENLVFDTWHFLATDPRDKIYGVYGLLNKKAQVDGQSGDVEKLLWRADYTKPVEQVYAEATKQIMLDAGELRILSAVLDHSWRKIESLPSWTPDYSVTWTNMMTAHSNAAGSLPVPSPLIEESGHWGTLTIHGLHIDTVLAIGTTTSGPGDLKRFFDPSWLEITLLIPSSYHKTGHQRSEVLWRTLCANKGPDGRQPAPQSFSLEFSEMISTMLIREAWVEESKAGANPELNFAPNLVHGIGRVLDMFSDPPLAGLSKADLECEFSEPSRNFSSQATQMLVYTLLKAHVLTLTEPEESCCIPPINILLDLEQKLAAKNEDPSVGLLELLRQGGTLVRTLQSTVGRRRLFATKNRYLGLGPAGMQADDEIWVFPSAGAAFVLRKIVEEADGGCSRYKFIGESYIHGVMDGEAAAGKEDEMKRISLI
ncbi:ankyrin and HET domain-containing protein [Nannizzia gypsea CBS 118893]|uniref:Ankyrin and HET domain-containing protein n=1 Tax=Arthroderma gypseum (strain ATCC MYA-4604 / CBS 118893) TaxID=535722 RepID=E4V6Z7_ARTGP|nr:ankyrin and HET domain-containing protein [Nannizzia gypsea CBS 118893]EFQ96863.1 ankyrin and HET domain-containing protein [Nannizzia gypsea CBS 118893]